MQQYESVKRLIGRGISDDPLMLHGTSVESIFELANTGRLPTGVLEVSDEETYDYLKGRLFFAPISSNFKGERYRELSVVSREHCFRDAMFYARLKGAVNHLASELNCQTAETYTLLVHMHTGSIDWKDLQRGLKKDGIEASLKRIKSIYSKSEKRRGVIIEPDASILELPNEVAADDDEAIAVECPSGLDMKYVSGIEPLGPDERSMINKFIEGKLHYNGFRTDL
jgi:hypothetical protein